VICSSPVIVISRSVPPAGVRNQTLGVQTYATNVLPRGDVAQRPSVATAVTKRMAMTPAIVASVALVLVFAACSGSGSGRPSTQATLRIVSPAPNAITGPTVDVKLILSHAKLVPPTQVGGKIVGDRGHIHVSVDGALISMTLQVNQSVTDLRPGIHTIQAEFVASDHLPFKNRVVAAVTFRVS
jgi:hypothetical protein